MTTRKSCMIGAQGEERCWASIQHSWRRAKCTTTDPGRYGNLCVIRSCTYFAQLSRRRGCCVIRCSLKGLSCSFVVSFNNERPNHPHAHWLLVGGTAVVVRRFQLFYNFVCALVHGASFREDDLLVHMHISGLLSKSIVFPFADNGHLLIFNKVSWAGLNSLVLSGI